MKYKTIWEFQDANPTKEDKERVLKEMTNDEVNELINLSSNIYQKIWLSKFRKKDADKADQDQDH